jgi:AbrB family looped-hinge helix DNA binding protein
LGLTQAFDDCILYVKNQEVKEPNMVVSKLSSKNQITIPREMREGAGLHAGDMVVYEMREAGVIAMKRLSTYDAAFHAALSSTLDEWETQADDDAFRDL